MTVPYAFGSATTSIPLSELDANFNTPITLGNTAIQLGNTVTTLNNMTLANATVSSGNVTVTSASLSGNLTFTGTGNRITGDFSNATVANRVMFQTSTVNGTTSIATLPNGTNATSSVLAFGGSDPANAPFTGFNNTATESQILASKIGTGTFLPMTFFTGGSERMRIDTSGNVGIGTSSPGSFSGTVKLVVGSAATTTTPGAVTVYSGTATYGGLYFADGTVGNQLYRGAVEYNHSTDALLLYSGGSERMRIDSAGNVGIGGTPAKLLDLAANNTGITTGDPLNTLRFSDTDTTSAAGQPMGRIEWYSADTDTAGVKAYIQAQATDGSPDADMVFATNHVSGGGTAERMRIQYDGNVGIGTSSPGAKLDVRGSSTFLVNATNPTAWISVDSALTTGSMYNQWNTTSNVGISGTYTNHAYTFVTNNTERARIDTSGNLLVGTTTDNVATAGFRVISAAGDPYLDMSRTGSASARMIGFYRNASGTLVGQITTTSTATTYTTSSDYRLKHDIQPMTGALAKVQALKPVTYKWNSDDSNGEGFIAHELAEVVPDAVTGEKDAVNEDGSIKPQGIDTSFLVATLTAAIKEQQQMIETLQAEVAALKGA